ncbi:MAG: DUF4105 domain-containing protein [Planctomycetota bacterium]
MNLAAGLVFVLFGLPSLIWMAGAIFFDVGRKTELGRAAAVLWVLAVIAKVIFWEPTWQPVLAYAVIFVGFLAWWFSLKPRADRQWRDDLMIPASADVDQDTVTVRNVRHSIYRSLEDVTPRYSDRTYRLSGLRAMDLLVSNWGSTLMSHPFAIFEFEPSEPGGEPQRIGFSLEVRNLKGEGFSLFRNLYRQNELYCAAADERDLIRRRAEHEGERQLYLYRLKIQPETMRIRFLEYISLINDLAAEPRWYNAITTNCTTGVFRIYTENRPKLDWRVLANGKLDEYLYQIGALDQSLPFDELKEACRISEVAPGLPDEGYGCAIRIGRPGFEAVTGPCPPETTGRETAETMTEPAAESG